MITQKEIMELVKEYAKSPEGKKKIKEVYGVNYKEGFDRDSLKMYTEDMRNILHKHILSVPSVHGGSALSSISLKDIVSSRVVKGRDGIMRASIRIDVDLLYRDSLIPDKYGGIDNILLLFTKGYNSGHSINGDWYFRGQIVAEGVDSVTHREPNNFLANAVAEFNNKYKGKAVAKLEGYYAKAISEIGGENG